MQALQIPASIWLNFLVLVAAAGVIWFKLTGASAGNKAQRRQRTRQAGRAAPVDR
jgi:hypothetical protein